MNTYFKFLVNLHGSSTGTTCDVANNADPQHGGVAVPDISNPGVITDWQTDTLLNLVLVLDFGAYKGNGVSFYFKDAPTSTYPVNEHIKTIAAPFNGQTFTFGDRHGEGLVVYMGTRTLYDEAINVNDLCSALKLYSDYLIENGYETYTPFELYRNQKMEDPGHSGSYIPDPGGSYVMFEAMGWYLSTKAKASITGPVTTSGAGGIYPYNWSDTNISFKGVNSPSVEATATIEAIRIENNPKKVADYV
jgi:hypothetical protein